MECLPKKPPLNSDIKRPRQAFYQRPQPTNHGDGNDRKVDDLKKMGGHSSTPKRGEDLGKASRRIEFGEWPGVALIPQRGEYRGASLSAARHVFLLLMVFGSSRCTPTQNKIRFLGNE
jgi:hypothetical protein